MNLTEVSNTPYTHCGITAPVALWISVGMEFLNHGESFTLRPKDCIFDRSVTLSDGQLIEARIHTGSDGEAALVWLIQERRRQAEESARNTAIYRQAEAQKKAGDDAIHAARIHRQAAELECKARGIDITRGE